VQAPAHPEGGPAPARWLRRLHAAEDALLALLVLLLLALALAQIGLRLAADTGFTWAEPVSRLMVMWLALLGALAATRQRKHIAIDALPRLLGPRARRVAWVLAQLTGAVAAGVLAWLALDLIALELEAPSRLPGGIPGWAGMLVLPAGFGLMALRFLLCALAPPPPLRPAEAE
jgi:TRAP-type C4-dicarboxylate transport system permease small subunit